MSWIIQVSISRGYEDYFWTVEKRFCKSEMAKFKKQNFAELIFDGSLKRLLFFMIKKPFCFKYNR